MKSTINTAAVDRYESLNPRFKSKSGNVIMYMSTLYIHCSIHGMNGNGHMTMRRSSVMKIPTTDETRGLYRSPDNVKDSKVFIE